MFFVRHIFLDIYFIQASYFLISLVLLGFVYFVILILPCLHRYIYKGINKFISNLSTIFLFKKALTAKKLASFFYVGELQTKNLSTEY